MEKSKIITLITSIAGGVAALLLIISSLNGCNSSEEKNIVQATKKTETDMAEEKSTENVHHDLNKNLNGLYEIYSAEDLLIYREFLESEMQSDYESTGYSTHASSGAVLMKDIDMSSVCSEKTGGWRPIGNRSVQVNGDDGEITYINGDLYNCEFDGNGHTISALFVDDNSAGGLFCELWECDIHDLVFADCIINSNGVIASTMKDGTVRNICIEESVKVSGSGNGDTGSIVGSALEWNSNAVFEHCVNYAAIHGKGYTGGIVGYCKGHVDFTECINYGEIIGENDTGGIVGRSQGGSNYDGIIKADINYGKISISENGQGGSAGGIAGYNGSRVCYCVNVGTVDGGSRGSSWDICYNQGAMNLCINIGIVLGDFANITTEGKEGCASLKLGDPSLTDGSLVQSLNEQANEIYWTQGEEYWKQGKEFPIWSESGS